MATQVELYRFYEAESETVWAYTSTDIEVTYNTDVYLPIPIGRSDIESKGDISRANLEISMPLDNPAAIRWMQDNGEKYVGLTLFQRSRAGVYSVIWKGRLAGTIPGLTNIRLNFESLFTSLRRTGLRARFQTSCRHPLYGRGCRLNAEDYATPLQCTAISGNSLNVTGADAVPNGTYVGGMVRSPEGILSYIVGHEGNIITVQRLSFSLLKESSEGFPFEVNLYPGCDHSRVNCNAFDNILNYGGFDWIPDKNPMGGSSVV